MFSIRGLETFHVFYGRCSGILMCHMFPPGIICMRGFLDDKESLTGTFLEIFFRFILYSTNTDFPHNYNHDARFIVALPNLGIMTFGKQNKSSS